MDTDRARRDANVGDKYDTCPGPHVWKDLGDFMSMRCDQCQVILTFQKTAMARLVGEDE